MQLIGALTLFLMAFQMFWHRDRPVLFRQLAMVLVMLVVVIATLRLGYVAGLYSSLTLLNVITIFASAATGVQVGILAARRWWHD